MVAAQTRPAPDQPNSGKGGPKNADGMTSHSGAKHTLRRITPVFGRSLRNRERYARSAQVAPEASRATKFYRPNSALYPALLAKFFAHVDSGNRSRRTKNSLLFAAPACHK
ncbi:MAG: hypothetical protein DLM68_18450 [Hyphomicrobiales bacterium]|nr:MAG: hypothetical protein DLM68_18450 [Hyphomicrobiales bacterium]